MRTISDEPGLEAQTRDVLNGIERVLAAYEGSTSDVVRVRVYIEVPHMDEASLETVHDVRNGILRTRALPRKYPRKQEPAHSIVTVAAIFEQRDGVVETARIALNGTGPHPVSECTAQRTFSRANVSNAP